MWCRSWSSQPDEPFQVFRGPGRELEPDDPPPPPFLQRASEVAYQVFGIVLNRVEQRRIPSASYYGHYQRRSQK